MVSGGPRRRYSTDSTHSFSLLFGSAPILVAATWPPLNSIIVGMPRTPYLRGICGFSSILTLETVTLPAMSVASSSRNGAIILQGPHHSAQKSTRTGSLARNTISSKLLSLTAVGFMAKPSRKLPVTLVGERRNRRQGKWRASSAGLIGIRRGPSVHRKAHSIGRSG